MSRRRNATLAFPHSCDRGKRMKKPQPKQPVPLWRKILSCVALAGVLLFVLFAGLNFYRSIQKLDNSLKFNSFSFTGLYDLITGRKTEKKETVTVSVQDAAGVRITSQNPVEVIPGEQVVFTYETDEGTVIDSVIGADSFDDSEIVISSVRYPTTVAINSRIPVQGTAVCRVADFGDGYGELPGTVKTEQSASLAAATLSFSAEAEDCFEFVCYTVGAPASEGGKVISETPDTVLSPADLSVTYYANFRRTHAYLTLAEVDGLVIKTPARLRAALGSRAFFVVDTEPGTVIEKAPEGCRFEDGILYVDSVSAPELLVFETRRLAGFSLAVLSADPASGTATLTPQPSGMAWEGEFYTAKAVPAKNRQFLGWTRNKTLEAGGEIVSESATYLFTPTTDSILYANFGVVYYTVSVAPYEGLEILSDNPAKIIAGTDASFEFSLLPGYYLDTLPDGVTVYNNSLVFRDVSEDTVIYVHTWKNGYPEFGYFCDSASFGMVSSSHTPGKYSTGTLITLTVTGGHDQFTGWSIGSPVSAGGKVFSTSAEYSFNLSTGVRVYANFEDPARKLNVAEGKSTILYFPNGGVCTDKNAGLWYSDTQSVEFYYCPNALPSTGIFTREGYILLGYTTNADGTGDFYGPGWNIVIPESRTLSLFCRWIKVSDEYDFAYSESSSGLTLTGYHGADSTVVKPETIGGKKVVGIGKGFITSNPAVESIIFNRNIKTVAAGAVTGCNGLVSIWCFNSVTSMPDNWYSSCPEFRTFNVLAMKMPSTMSSCYGTYTIKYDRLHAACDKPRIVIFSGSNTAYGINSPELMSKLSEAGYEYDVTNFGQNASTSAAFYIETCVPLLKEGDIVIHEPELNKYQYGYNELSNNIWTIYEGSYEAFSVVDIRHYNLVFSTFATFNSSGSANSRYDVYNISKNSLGVNEPNINRYGDLSRYKAQLSTDSNWTGWKPSLDKYDANGGVGGNSYTTATNLIKTEKQVAELNRVYDMMAERGVKVLFSFPSIVKTSLTKASQDPNGSEQQGLINAVDTYLHCTRISVPSDYALDRKYSYNTVYHITTEGSIVRTDRLAADLIAYFKK